MNTYTDSTVQALNILRDPGYFQWYVIPLLAFVVYVYAVEIERKNWNVVMAGLAFYGLEWFMEILNGLWLHFSRYSAVWTTPGDTAYLLLIGLNIEISMMFAVAGVVFAKLLPEDRTRKIVGLPNRWFFVIANSVFCVFVEVVLNRWGALVWAYPWWNWPNVWLIIIIGYSLFMIFSFWVYDLESMRKKVTVVSTMYAVDIVCLIVFMGILRWI
jgi:hypothetical protein